MSTETRTIRPFVGLDALADVLDEALLHFGQDTCQADHGITVDLSPHEFLVRPVSIEWRSDAEGFEAFRKRLVEDSRTAGFAPDDLSLVAIASSSFLKIANVLLELPVSQLEDLERITDLTAAGRPAAFSTPYSGFAVTAYVLLTRSLEPTPLKPHLRGTWIASTRFRVETTLGPALLPPTPLTDVDRDRLGLPAKTIRYAYFGDHDLLQPYGQQEQPVFYVDEELLAQMNARRRAPASKALQLQLAQDFVTAVVHRASAHPEIADVGYDDVRTSLLGSVIQLATGPGATPGDRQALLGKVKDQPEYVIARAEHIIDVAAGYSDALEDGES